MSDDAPWTAMTIDDVESVDWQGSGIDWRPVRRALGVDFVGVAAYTATRAGQFVVEPHTEVDDGRGHQELYVVTSGTARFVIDGTEVEAPAGTLLRIDPQVRREATAVEAGTAVLAFGGQQTFQVAAAEWIERARPHIRSDPTRAAEIIEDLRRQMPDHRGIVIGEALLAVGRGDESTARLLVSELVDEHPDLASAVSLDPDLRELLPR